MHKKVRVIARCSEAIFLVLEEYDSEIASLSLAMTSTAVWEAIAINQ